MNDKEKDELEKITRLLVLFSIIILIRSTINLLMVTEGGLSLLLSIGLDTPIILISIYIIYLISKMIREQKEKNQG